MRVLSLFSGIGGFELGLAQAGLNFEVVFSEIDPAASRVLHERFPGCDNLGDVRNVQSVGVDLIVAGFPCQDLSIANVARRGLEGARSGLVHEFVRLKEQNPKAEFIVENVASMGARYEQTISMLLGVKPVAVDGAAFTGAHRRRLFWTSFPVRVEGPADGGPKLIDALEPLERVRGRALSARALAYMDREVRGGRNHWEFNHPFDTAKDKGPRLTANLKRGVPYNVLIDRRSEAAEGRPLVRSLAPVEAERLMGFPDDWTAGLSEGARLKAVGNSVNVPVIAALARGLK